ncbi:MAG: enoyl-CoA hydratase/isomerase family protein [Chloroflexi bacterium]|nr:enoyl-CoA hydratase/isomerase family protein [Chloroflexota bacterium]
MPDLLYEKQLSDHYATFTMNRPERLNALGGSLQRDLQLALNDFNNDREMWAGILTGAGRAFSAGADLREMADRNARVAEINTRFERGEITSDQRAEQLLEARGGGAGAGPSGTLFSFSRSPKPFIAAINGLAVGGGTERAIDCDIRIISTEAYMGLFEVKRGILPGSGIHVLSRILPYGEAMYVGLTGDRISPQECLRIGLVHEVVPPERLMPRAIEIAKMICENAPIAVQGVKAIGQFWRQYDMDGQYRLSEWVNRWVGASEDSKEGPRAFSEKRQPKWQNR